MNQEILKVLTYYSHFSYPPRDREIHRYLSIKATLEEVRTALEDMYAQKSIAKRHERYAENASYFDLYEHRQKHADSLIRETSWIIHLICRIPTISYAGISGSLAMHDAQPDDDVDLMLVVKPYSVWKTRAIVLFILRCLSFLGNRSARKVCINMIWESHDLKMPAHKQTEYGGHELYQLRTCMNKYLTHESLMAQNRWASRLFPNVHINTSHPKQGESPSQKGSSADGIEQILAWMQKKWLARKGYIVKEYGAQVWLIQDDWEKK